MTAFLVYLFCLVVGFVFVLGSAVLGHFGGGDHGFHEFNNRPRLRIVIGNDYGYGHGCGYFYDRWLDTGSFYWKQKFLICRGRW